MKRICILLLAAVLFTFNQAEAEEHEFSILELVESSVTPEELREYALNGFTLDMVSTTGYVDIINMDGDVLMMFIENAYWLSPVPEGAVSLWLLDGVDQEAVFDRPDTEEILLCLAENYGNFTTATKKALLGLPYEYEVHGRA